MNVVRVDINVHGPAQLNELKTSDKNYIVDKAIELFCDKYIRGKMDGVRIHVNSTVEFPDEATLTYFMLSFTPFYFYEEVNGKKQRITVGIK